MAGPYDRIKTERLSSQPALLIKEYVTRGVVIKEDDYHRVDRKAKREFHKGLF